MAVRAKCMLPRSVAYVNGRMIKYDQVPLNPEIFTRKNWPLLTTLIWGITFGDTFNQFLDRVKLPDGLQMLNLGTRVRARRSLSGSESDSKSIHIDDSCWINNHHWIYIGRVRILQSFPLCSKTTFASDPTHCSWCRYIWIFTLNDMFINKGYWDITSYWDITWYLHWYWDITCMLYIHPSTILTSSYEVAECKLIHSTLLWISKERQRVPFRHRSFRYKLPHNQLVNECSPSYLMVILFFPPGSDQPWMCWKGSHHWRAERKMANGYKQLRSIVFRKWKNVVIEHV